VPRAAREHHLGRELYAKAPRAAVTGDETVHAFSVARLEAPLRTKGDLAAHDPAIGRAFFASFELVPEVHLEGHSAHTADPAIERHRYRSA